MSIIGVIFISSLSVIPLSGVFSLPCAPIGQDDVTMMMFLLSGFCLCCQRWCMTESCAYSCRYFSVADEFLLLKTVNQLLLLSLFLCLCGIFEFNPLYKHDLHICSLIIIQHIKLDLVPHVPFCFCFCLFFFLPQNFTAFIGIMLVCSPSQYQIFNYNLNIRCYLI